MSSSPRLSPRPPLLELGPAIASAGFETLDHRAIILELEGLVADQPARAVAKRRAEFLAGRWAARQALAALGIEAIPGRDEAGLPRWPEEVIGSITHGGDRALSAVARRAEVRSLGIDAERLMPSASPELCRRICDEAELARLERALSRPGHHALTLAFSAKESLYKCLHPLIGKFMDFHAARVTSVTRQGESGYVRGELTLELCVDWSSEFACGRRFRAPFVLADEHVETAVVLGP
jgi:enterobactin synthetase component D